MEQQQNNKLFVGNVAYATDVQTLVDLFSQYGKIEDSYKPKEKGFCFITFSTAEEAQAAMEALHGTEVDGRALNISIAQPRQPRENNGFGGGNRGGGRSFGGGNRGGDRGGYERRDRY